jgi:hypothetical protein
VRKNSAVKYKTDDKQHGGNDYNRYQRIHAVFLQDESDEGPEHHELAVSDVKDPGDAVLKAETHRDQRIDAADEQPAEEYIYK